MIVSISSPGKTTKNTTNGLNFESKYKHTTSKKGQLKSTINKEHSDSRNEVETPQFEIEEKLAPLQMIEDDKIQDQETDFNNSKNQYHEPEKSPVRKSELKVETFTVHHTTQKLSPELKENSPTNSSKRSKHRKLSSPRSPGLLRSKKLSERKRFPSSHEELYTEESKADLFPHKDALKIKGIRKPSGQFTCSQGLLNEGNSIITANQSSENVTAHFNSTRLKSMTTNESPGSRNKDIGLIRDLHEDPLSFLNQFEVLLT